MTARIRETRPPLRPVVAERLASIMPKGVPPLLLFATMARDARLFERFTADGLIDRGHLTSRQREIVIDRVTALCGCEYERGVHIGFFAQRARLGSNEIAALGGEMRW